MVNMEAVKNRLFKPQKKKKRLSGKSYNTDIFILPFAARGNCWKSDPLEIQS